MAFPGPFRRTLLLAMATGVVGTTLGSACALDPFGELAISDAGRAVERTHGMDADPTLPSLTGLLPDLDATPRVHGDELAAKSDAAVPMNAGFGDASGDVPSGSCDFSGTWASRLVIDVRWVPQGLTGVILAPGSGQIKQWILSTRVATGQATTDTTVVCGIVLPDFSGTQIANGEKYGIQFPNSSFDNGVLPSFSVQGTLVGSQAGATYSTLPSAALLGLTLPNATTASWPATVTTEVDSDHDGKPGVTALVEQGGGYSLMPAEVLGGRADRLYVAIRQVTEVTANALDCDHFAGTVMIPQIADSTSTAKYAIDSHVIGCRVAADAGDCRADQTSFLDTTQPVFSPSGGTTFTSVRVANSATCAAVRQKLP
jgi:hypothetical protein